MLLLAQISVVVGLFYIHMTALWEAWFGRVLSFHALIHPFRRTPRR